MRDERVLRELELDGVVRLFRGSGTSQAAAVTSGALLAYTAGHRTWAVTLRCR